MTIYLGQTLADPQTLPPAPPVATDELYLNPTGLLAYLEGFYGLGVPNVNRTALRTEQYRQLLQADLEQRTAAGAPAPFYAASFAADTAATAAELLSRRDELLEAGYALHRPAPAAPERLAVLHDLEALLLDDRYDFRLLAGRADRLNTLLTALPEDRHPRLRVRLNEPRHLMGPGTRRLLAALERVGDEVAALPEPTPTDAATDLGRWQRLLTEREAPRQLSADGSLLLIRAERETHIAAYLARLLRDNPNWRPGALLTVRNQTLDNALLAEGLPSLGVPSTSLARPSLQVLKLITTFLWTPLEVDRIMEFVSLVTKPLHWRLANRIAVFLADTPGLFGPRWFAMVEGFFSDMEEKRNWPKSRLAAVRAQYENWFRRRRYNRNERVPKNDLRGLLNDLREWALEEFSEARSPAGGAATEPTGLLVLAAQTLRAMELLDARPETDLSYLEVERLVRTVYEPAPVQFQPREAGALPVTFAPASALKTPRGAELERLLWWDFIEHEPDYFFSRFYPEELAYLADAGVALAGPDLRNDLLTWSQLRPVLHPRRQLVLCLPNRVDGSPVEAHPLLGDLEAAFGEEALERITVRIDEAGHEHPVLAGQRTPRFAGVPVRPLARPVPTLTLARPGAVTERDPETPTALEDMLYYPYKWVFRHQLELKKTPILSIAAENRLRGNLSHLFIEQLLNQLGTLPRTEGKYTAGAVHDWIDANAGRLLASQGAVLLEYGQEPERVQFVRTMKYAAWSLVHYIQENGWRVRGSEESVVGELERMGGANVRGRADLILERGGAEGRPYEVTVVDLKWRGKTVFRNLLRNAKDVQLCLYAEFISQNRAGEEGATVHPAPDRVHTAYYVIRDALMLARNELAFANIETVRGNDDEAGVVQAETLRKIRATYNWRWEQFREGTVEIRCTDTLGDLEDLYEAVDKDALLEMADDDARFDDYRSLIGLVR